MTYVPKIIHQIMHNFKEKYPPKETTELPEIPEKWKLSPEEWKRLHPGWQYMLWDSYKSRELIRINYPWFLEKYDSYKYPIQRVDSARYFILYHYGGVYSDLDLYPLVNIEQYISKSVESYFVFHNGYSRNSFMASSKKAKIWETVFDNLMNYKRGFWVSLSKHFTIMLESGPLLVNKSINEYSSDTIGRLPKGFSSHECDTNSSDTILKSLDGMSWCGYETYFYNFVMKHYVLLIVLGILFVIVILVLIFYFAYNLYRCKCN